MSSGLYSGTSGLALGAGLYRSVSGLWGGASGLINGFGGGFSPATLFASGEPGGWYDIDPAYLYQDSAGTTPVTAPGQTVGMVLDRSKGLVLGPELGDGTIDNVSNWVVFGSNTIAQDGDGVAITFVNNAAGAYQFLRAASGLNTDLIVGKWYRVTGQAKVNSGSANVAVVNASTLTSAAITSTSFVDFTIYFLCDNATTNYIAAAKLSAGETITIRALSVKELPGNHLTQSTLSNRAIYGIEPFGGRRNLLTYTEQFDNAAWPKTNATITANAAVAPDGTTTADTLTATANGGYIAGNWSSSASGDKINSIWIKRRTGTGAVYLYRPDGAGFATINPTSDWVRYSSATITGTAINLIVQLQTNGDQIDIWGAQGEVSSTATAYQRVTDQWNVTEAGKTSVGYLQFDGSDDWLVSPTITPGIDKAQVFAGVRKLSDAVVGMVVEASTNIGSNNGAVAIYAPTSNVTATYQWLTKGTGLSAAPSPANYASPITNVLTGIGDIAADTAILRANGVQAATSTTDQGTGNYLAYPLYVGRRGGITLAYNGRIYSLIVRFGANLDAATITQTENWVAGKTGIYTVDQLNRLNARTADGTLYSAYAAADASSNNYLVTNAVRAADGTSYNVI